MTTPSAGKLLDMARSPSRAQRGALVDSLSAICFAPGRTPTDRERALFFEILRTLIHDVDAEVRRNLAKRLSGCEDAPHDLVMQLAGDAIEIAHPMLARSQVLQDDDLVSLILAQDRQHGMAISKRPDISAAVSETLIETGDAKIIASLLENETAQIRSEAMERLADSAADMEEIREPLRRRRRLRPTLAERLSDPADTMKFMEEPGADPIRADRALP